MFYLRNILNVLKKRPLKSLLFIISSIALFSIILNYSEMNQTIKEYLKNEKPHPFFEALIEGDVNQTSIQSRVQSLPSVTRVSLKDNAALKKHADNVISEAGLAGADFLDIQAFSGFVIYLEKNATASDVRLVKEYFKRLAGSKSVHYTPLTTPKGPLLTRNKTIYNFLMNYASISIILFFIILWVLCQQLIMIPIQKISYITEKFQNKKYVCSKIILSLSALTAIFAIFVNLLSNSLNINSLIVLGALILINTAFYLRKWKWE